MPSHVPHILLCDASPYELVTPVPHNPLRHSHIPAYETRRPFATKKKCKFLDQGTGREVLSLDCRRQITVTVTVTVNVGRVSGVGERRTGLGDGSCTMMPGLDGDDAAASRGDSDEGTQNDSESSSDTYKE